MRAGTMAIIAGVLVLLTGGAGSTLLFEELGDLIEDRWPDAGEVVAWTLKVLSFLAALGGLAIIIGGVLMILGMDRVGRLITWLAAFMALVGWVLLVLVVLDRGEGSGGWFVDAALWINLLGIVLAFWARP